ncbi:MAG: DNA polymerase Y family protein [Myxococcales bacterium]|nr:DNA polymerase Y family protein [Myxococcales bacterium]MDD9970251.1 DNA polymerase Y family protein [Myxococcales bacterium]
MTRAFTHTQLSLLADRGRIACVDVPALALQLVLKRHPTWRTDPVVIVEDDRPLAPIVWANRAARAFNIRRGQPFGQAKTLTAKLRAAVVPDADIEAAVDLLFDQLLDFSPYVEPVVDLPGLFWLDPNGLGGLFGDLNIWARKLHTRLAEEQLAVGVAVGFMRPFLFALSRVQVGPRVFDDPHAERLAALEVPLARLAIPPQLQHDLALLDIHTVGTFLDLPAAGLAVRYGADAAALHAFLSGKTWTPLQPKAPAVPLSLSLQVDPPDDNHTRLLFGLKNLLHAAIAQLSPRSEAITALALEMRLEGSSTHHERLETAAPTLDVMQLADLLRLRLSGVELSAAVEQLDITIEHTRIHPKQMGLLYREGAGAGSHAESAKIAAANRALSRIKASFKGTAVTRAFLKDAHLPEAGADYEEISEVTPPRPRDPGNLLPLVRRVFAPIPLPPFPKHEPEAWLGAYGAVTHMFGPYRIAGGWWVKRRERDYYFVETQRGEILWIFYDRPRQRWLLHGIVY